MANTPHPESAESLARARRYFAESLEDLEEAGAEHMTWTMGKDSSLRLDKYVQGRLKGVSRSQVQKLIDLGAVTVNGTEGKASQKLKGGDVIEVVVPPKPSEDLIAEDIPLDILYEDDTFIAINKQAGIIVHPARSRLQGTMINALAYHFEHHPGNTVDRTVNAQEANADAEPRAQASDEASGTKPSLSSVGQSAARPGVIHRLDMNTTGVILFAKQNEGHWLLAKQFEERTNTKAYLAVVHGNPEPVNHPENDPRLSIALYYYTATWEEGRTSQSTVFKQRPGSNDAKSNEAILRVVRDIVPPLVYRKSRNIIGRIKRRF